MENPTTDQAQTQNAPASPTGGRDAKGLFAAGNSLGGRKPSIWANQADVAERLLNKYTPSEIVAIASDPVRLDKECSSFQAMILIQLANALSARDNGDMALERERLLDRHGGKAVQRVESKVSLSVETESALLEGRKRVAKARQERENLSDIVVEYSEVAAKPHDIP